MLSKYFQVGTVIETPSEFFTGRLTKKERKTTLADELLSDPYLGQYRRRKVRKIEEQMKRSCWGLRSGKIKAASHVSVQRTEDRDKHTDAPTSRSLLIHPK